LQYKALSAALALLLSTALPALAAETFTLSLDPVAYDNSTRDVILGQGRMTASLDGNRLTVSGNFSGLSSPATTVRVGLGLDFGVPATDFFANLTAASATAGGISGTLNLTDAQVDALKKWRLFVQLNTARGSDGSLWGWFQPSGAGALKFPDRPGQPLSGAALVAAPRTNAPRTTARSGR
jgi:hypothetical protein